MFIIDNKLIFVLQNSLYNIGQYATQIDLTDYLIKPLILICVIASALSLTYLAGGAGSKWVRRIINGVERIVLVSAAGTMLYDYWGKPIFGPGDKGPSSSGPGYGSGSGNGTGTGNVTGGGSGQGGTGQGVNK